MPEPTEKGSVFWKVLLLALIAATGLFIGNLLAAISLVQQATGTGKAGTTVITITPTAGNATILAAAGLTTSGANPTISSITQTNVTWTKLSASNSTADTEIWYVLSVPGSPGSSVTVNWSKSSKMQSAANVSEWSGLNITDGSATPNSGTVVAATTNSFTTTNANDLIFAAVGYDSTTAPTTQPSLYTPLTFASVSNTGSIGVQADYQIVSLATSYVATWTLPAGTGNYGAVIGAFGTATAAPGLLLRGVGELWFPPWLPLTRRFKIL